MATLELFDEAQAAYVDALEAGLRVSGPVRLAFEVRDSEASRRPRGEEVPVGFDSYVEQCRPA